MSASTPQVQEGTSSSTGNPPSYDELRQQAGPLPTKRGELGFIEGVHVQRDGIQDQNTITLPARHPAEREDDSATVPVPLTPVPNTNAPSQTTDNSTPNAPTQCEPPRILKYLKPKKIPAFQGLRITTLLAFFAQFAVFAACIIGWVFTARKLTDMSKQGGNIPGGISSAIFIHVVFCIAVVGQLVFLERRIYRLRAERYTFLHPGEMLPRYAERTLPGGDLSFAFAPWNRPPLPTYAAALAQSGHGTGDVDDHLIAVPPPPAYGNTRGSTLLLSGFLRDSLRAQRPPTIHSEHDVERGEGERDNEDNGNRDDHLQQTLAQLERRSSR